MGILVAGLVVFLGVHLFPHFNEKRKDLIGRIGEGPYKGLFSLVSLAGIALIAWGYSLADYQHLWQGPSWARKLGPLFMLPACYCFIASGAPSNLKRLINNPLDWSILLWAAFHLLNNGDVKSLLLFGSFAIYALFNMWSSNRRYREEAQPVPWGREFVYMAIAMLAYGALVMFHPALFGVAAQ